MLYYKPHINSVFKAGFIINNATDLNYKKHFPNNQYIIYPFILLTFLCHYQKTPTDHSYKYIIIFQSKNKHSQPTEQ